MAIPLDYILSLKPFLEQLQEGFIIIGPTGKLRLASRQIRQWFGHKVLKGSLRDFFGTDPYEELCGQILRGEVNWVQWREIRISIDDNPLDMAVCSSAVEFEGEKRGVITVFLDISSEVGLHKKYKALLDKQRDINRNLRREIAKKLREHEDDIAQFSEILQLAPAIFASFMNEARAAVTSVEPLLAKKIDEDQILKSFRAMHTLKGNARSLGLHLIGGRAHSVEDLLEKIRDQKMISNENLEAFSEILSDLRRAIDRAQDIRQRLGELTAQAPTLDQGSDFIEGMVLLESLLQKSLEISGPDGQLAPYLSQALSTVSQVGYLPLQHLFNYLMLMAGNVVRDPQDLAPIVTTTGGEFKIPPSVYQALANALPHLIRNAIAHGIEGTQERSEMGKPAAGTIRIDARVEAGLLYLRLSDDGRGLDFERLKEKAIKQDIEIPPHVEDLIFHPRISTAQGVSLESGRGVGTCAAKEAVELVGGKIKVVILERAGTAFDITIPVEHGVVVP